MEERYEKKVEYLIGKGVRILDPSAVEIGEDIDPDRISGEQVTIYPGCRIYGGETLIMGNTTLGFEAPVTIENCQLGTGVKLKGGFFRESVFLQDSSAGSGAQIREGCILEEEANTAHCVGLKQTILFPFVTLGSLINFCDCLMAGGTSRKDHSEVGSSYIHFNYTPNQDKATPSLIGDVPRGVMLDRRPVFLGGQGGLVGPTRVGFGSVISAGTILREDCPDGTLYIGGSGKTRRKTFYPRLYREVNRRVRNNIYYIANLLALRQWYLHARVGFFREDGLSEGLLKGSLGKLDLALTERLKRLEHLADRMEDSLGALKGLKSKGSFEDLIARKKEFGAKWPRVREELEKGGKIEGDIPRRDSFLEALNMRRGEAGGAYVTSLKNLNEEERELGTAWLKSVVEKVMENALSVLPSFQ